MHPVVRVHPETGRPNLLIGRHAHNIVGMDPDESTALIDELNDARDATVVVYCHHGRRSMMVTKALREQGFDRAVSMQGGIDAWSVEIDPSIPRY